MFVLVCSLAVVILWAYERNIIYDVGEWLPVDGSVVAVDLSGYVDGYDQSYFYDD
jgi:hypothetical protein